MLATKLKAPITWRDHDPEVDAFLDRLQGNILKGHGRSNAVFVFCRFREDSKGAARAFLKSQVNRVHSAHDQLNAADHKRNTGEKDKRPFVSLFLTKEGYDYFAVPTEKQPSDPSFQAGMASAQAKLNDPLQSSWDSHLRAPHLLIMVAVAGPSEAQQESTELLNSMGQIGDVAGGHSGEVIANQFFNEEGLGVENFGYVDGRSQPLVLTEDIPGEQGIDKWPVKEFPVDQFVVQDPGVNDDAAYGSYFVFRQLEQDVAGFKAREDEINVGFDDGTPDSSFPNRDSSGVGRLESGIPYEISNLPPSPLPTFVTNNFVYGADPPGCPHFAHIRKVNPRTDETRGRLMIRRGITYGTRNDAKQKPGDPSVMILADEPKDGTVFPSKGVGLLFQSYQANIADQFETTQKSANSGGNGGLDPVIGQQTSCPLDWPVKYHTSETEKVDFFSRDKAKPAGPYVTLLGGGYFFAPSLPFLKSL
jgi:deferrochelatase/peroxidase EfeB